MPIEGGADQVRQAGDTEPVDPAPGSVEAVTASTEAGAGAPTVSPGEARWPMALAVLALMALTMVPPYAVPGAAIGIAAFQGLLLATLIIGDPGRIDDRSRRVRRISIVLVLLLLSTTLGSTIILVLFLVVGAPEANSAGPLLVMGAKVWLSNNIAFALLYWQMDSGGPAERAYRLRAYPDLAFPQRLNLTTANAFSPTDTAPLSRWAKGAMGSQALISLVVIGLVVARAVNVFT